LEKEPDNFGLRTPYAGFAPLTTRASHPISRTQELWNFNWKSFFI